MPRRGKNSDNNKLMRENTGIAAVAATLETSAQAQCKVNKAMYVLAVKTQGIFDIRANFETLHVLNVEIGAHRENLLLETTQIKLLENSNKKEDAEPSTNDHSNEDLHQLHQNDFYKFNDETRKINNNNVSGDRDA